MKHPILVLLPIVACCVAHAAELHVSSQEPIVVTAPDDWTAKKEKPPSDKLPFETYRIEPPAGRNAVCLISILDKDHQQFAEADFLKKLLRGDSRPYVSSPDELPKLEPKELKLKEGLGFYVNFVDPDLVGKPTKKGSYKTATPVIISLGSK